LIETQVYQVKEGTGRYRYSLSILSSEFPKTLDDARRGFSYKIKIQAGAKEGIIAITADHKKRRLQPNSLMLALKSWDGERLS
jgi:hypothetical protein